MRKKVFNIYIAYLTEFFFSLATPNMSQNNWKYYDLLGQICSFFPSVTGPLYTFQTLFYECKSASVGFTTDSILLSPKPFSAKHIEITCPLEKLTNVKLEETEAVLFSCSQSSGPSSCSHLVSQPALIQGRKLSLWRSLSLAVVHNSRKPQLHLFPICFQSKMA